MVSKLPSSISLFFPVVYPNEEHNKKGINRKKIEIEKGSFNIMYSNIRLKIEEDVCINHSLHSLQKRTLHTNSPTSSLSILLTPLTVCTRVSPLKQFLCDNPNISSKPEVCSAGVGCSFCFIGSLC